MVSLTWEQITWWRLRQQHLLEPTTPENMLSLISHMIAIQAQVLSAAELQIGTRVQGLTAADVRKALWQDRTLIKTWAMRWTLHLIPAQDLPFIVGVMHGWQQLYENENWQNYFGMSYADFQALVEGAQAALTDKGLTREQLADAIIAHTNTPHLREHLLRGWGTLLKPLAYRGILCFGPSSGQKVTFIQPEHWIGAWGEPLDHSAALQIALRRFLTAYGPATIKEFARWIGMRVTDARKVFKAIGDAVVEVNVEGWQAWVLAEMLPAMESPQIPSNALHVRLIPYFDAYTIAIGPHYEKLLEGEVHKNRIYSLQGWVAPLVLVNGRIAGIWGTEKKRLTVEFFKTPTKGVKAGIEPEVARIAAFTEQPLELVYA